MQNQNRPRSNSMETTKNKGLVKITRSLSDNIRDQFRQIVGKKRHNPSFDESYIPKEASRQINRRRVLVKKRNLDLDSTEKVSVFMRRGIIEVNNARAPKNDIPLAKQPACFFDEADLSQAFGRVDIDPEAKRRRKAAPRTGSVSPSPQDLFEQLQQAQAKQSARQ